MYEIKKMKVYDKIVTDETTSRTIRKEVWIVQNLQQGSFLNNEKS